MIGRRSNSQAEVNFFGPASLSNISETGARAVPERKALVKEKDTLQRMEQSNEEETAAAVALAEAKANALIRPATRALLWVVLLGIVFFFLVKATLWVFYAMTSVLLVIVLAIFFAYLIAPLVELVRKALSTPKSERLLPRSLAIGIVYVVIFGSLSLAAWVLTPRLGSQMAEIAQQAPDYVVNAQKRADRLNKVLEDLNLPRSVREQATKGVANTIGDLGKYVTGEGFTSALNVLGYLPYLVLIPILAFFFLKDADSFRRSALMMLPQGRIRWRGDELFQDINSTLAAYIRAQLIACLLIGSICTTAFAIIGVRYALVLGVLAGLLEFIPLLGPVVVAVTAATVAGFDSGTKAFVVIIFLGALRITQDYVLYPRIIGSGIHLHPLAIILAILAGNELAGVAGIFLAIPLIAVLTVTYRHWLEHRGSAGLVAELLKPAETPASDAAQGSAAAPTPAAQPTPDAPRPEPAR
jgi:predicted PurR-regulated permease PerM